MTKMKLLYIPFVAASLLATGCIEEIDPMTSVVTQDQLNKAPNSAEKLATGITSSMSGQFIYQPSSTDADDYGYTSTILFRDTQGMDMVNGDGNSNWYTTWEFCGVALGPSYAKCQLPWTYYYGWIKNCDNTLEVTGDNPTDEDDRVYAGIARAMRAFYYMDLARMYAPETYGINSQAPTVPIITEKTTIPDSINNPRATNEQMWAFIISDLDAAETLLANYSRPDNTTPDVSVVYGLKARAYLVMEDWTNAAEYARKAQAGYTAMTAAQYTDRTTGFNTPNSAWMLSTKFNSDDKNITENDADSSWGSWMITELTAENGCGYASNYGYPFHIDRHLFETIPASDARKNCFIDFKIQEDLNEAYATEDDEVINAAIDAAIEYVREHNSDFPENMVLKNIGSEYEQGVGGVSVKFRPAGGPAGYDNQHIGFCVSVPLMRVEEMMLIEAEAAGMLSEPKGVELLTAFAKLRDPDYVYGTHNETYQSDYATAFQNEVWWQRRVEFWGEGLATFDIKRLNKGIIRSYPNTNHGMQTRWNTTTPPQWMTWCIIGTEADYNLALSGKNNPTPIRPSSDSPEYIFGN